MLLGVLHAPAKSARIPEALRHRSRDAMNQGAESTAQTAG